ncbi:hypothetical protein [Pseudodesulfovibrio pelocollis]|uniref:hypothetical protein n=1 Tax=Pseudodesulfovibrio pelocollis TaxID=3051432 RepID=UPI00255A89C2|nr:hypothetical protein [Pseudodesulfovibrio sp. SB368]
MPPEPEYVTLTQEEMKAERKERCFKLIERSKAGNITGSHSEQIMCAMALGRMDELTDESWTKDPWLAWFHRLDDMQREVVNEWREKHPHG